MKNCIILGFGRSGTSLMGGILFHSGYFMGENLYPPRESNPKGFFENDVINGINEKILANYDYVKIRNTNDPPVYQCSPFNPLYGQRWLSYIEPEVQVNCVDDSIIAEIQKAIDVPVFAYKDPRFSYTLPVWNRFLTGNVVKICMFRHPVHTVESVIKDCKTADYLTDFQADHEVIFKLWHNSYRRVLKYLNDNPDEHIIFVHYEQLLSKEILPVLSGRLEVDLDDHFISPDLNRTRSMSDAPRYSSELYDTLCDMSGFRKGGIPETK